MTLTYIFHSGFVLETEQSILVFDFRKASGCIKKRRIDTNNFRSLTSNLS